MMLPIALSVIDLLHRREAGGDEAPARSSNFAICMMLGIAYAASIGGIGTKIGTPPNGLLLGFVDTNFGHKIDFFQWLVIAMPLVAVFLPITWFLLTRVLYPVPRGRIEGARVLIQEEYERLGPVKTGERATFIVFTMTAACWMIRPILAKGLGTPPDYVLAPLVPGLSDAGIVVVAALVLFVIPVERQTPTFVMNWETAKRLPWGILILFGGGLSLAAAVKANGVAEFLGHKVAVLGGAVPSLVLVLLVTTMVIFLTELTSNTATTATLVPILAALGPGLGVHPYLLIFPAAIAASCAFMMPVATPPNAIVFGSGHLTIPQMCKAGLWLNLLGVALVTILTYAIIVPMLNLDTLPVAGGTQG
ncbi:MAG: SLC13 family permease [Planctomycetota bacterium]|jgi:sodium-dependent dicarboxylate transporter 2/3/5